MRRVKLASRFEGEMLVRPRRRPGPVLSLRGWLAGFAVLVCSAVLAVSTVNTLHERSVAVEAARRAAENVAESLAQQASDMLEAVDGGLLALSERVANDGTGPRNRDRLQEITAALATTMPRLHRLLIVDEHGRFVVSNDPWATGRNLTFADRPYFRYHREHPDPSVHISGPTRSETDNTFLVAATRRLDHLDGSFAGVAIAEIDSSYFDQTYANVDVGEAGSIALISGDGTVMDRKPRAFIGSSLRNAALFAEANRYQQAGTYVSPSAIDGVHRLFAFRRLDHYPLIVDVGLAESEYLAGWRSAARANSIALALVIAMIGGLAGCLGVQIGRRKSAEDELRRLALLDGLTELANRRHFDEVLEREWRRAARDQTSLALLMIDVDNFKAYNDCYGHQHGDTVLISIARAIAMSIVRPSDLAARYGGEEFAVILPVTNAANAVIVAERIRQSIVALGIPHAGGAIDVTSVSVGVASIVPARLSERATLVEAADAQLYTAKRRGRNCTCVDLDARRPKAAALAGAALPEIDLGSA